MSTISLDGRELPIVAEISRGIVSLYVDYHGRGPSKAKTVWRGDLVTCVLREVFTKPEELLVERGRFDIVRAQRQAISDEIRPLLRDVVESTMCRRVLSATSQVSPEGLASEVFLLDGDLAGDSRSGPVRTSADGYQGVRYEQVRPQHTATGLAPPAGQGQDRRLLLGAPYGSAPPPHRHRRPLCSV